MSHQVQAIKRCKPLLGTYVSIHLSAQVDADTLMDMSNLAFAKIHDIENGMSFHDPDSELSYLNREAASRPCKISDDMAVVLNTALEMSRLTNGRYDISIAPELMKSGLLPSMGHSLGRRHLPGTEHPVSETASWRDILIRKNTVHFRQPLTLNLGGIAKGYAVDKAFLSVCDQAQDLLINAGGDLRMKQWQGESVAIKMPGLAESGSINVPMKESALATTASYYMEKNTSAIIDPYTRQASLDKRSISIFAPSCIIADALTKVALLSTDAADVISSLRASATVIDPDGAIGSLY